MPNIFDQMQDSLFDTITTTFGEIATWLPIAGNQTFTAKVLYKDPSEKKGIGESDFELDNYVMEYRQGDFPGLKESVHDGNLETVSITTTSGILEYFVRKCTTKFDGRTIIAILNVK